MGIKFNLNSEKEKQIPEEFKDLAKDFADKGFITTSSENLINWARTGSLHWMTFGLACCAVEMMLLHYLVELQSFSQGYWLKLIEEFCT